MVVFKGRSGLGLVDKTGLGGGVAGEFTRQELERHGLFEPGVFGLIHHTHAPAAELRDNPIVGNGFTDH